MAEYYIYIMTNKPKTLYIGVTSDLVRRVYEHKQKLIEGFTKRYNMTRLAYYEEIPPIRDAIAREKQLKGWLRSRKIALIESMNPQWRDLSEEWYAAGEILRCAQNDGQAQNDGDARAGGGVSC